jgi:arsenical pump membrane protein
MPLLVAHGLLVCIVAVSIALMLLRPRGVPEVYWVGGGVLLLVALHLIPLRLAAHAAREGSDVYFFLAGMMLLSEVARESGVFDWISALAVQHAHRSGRRLFLLLYVAGVCVTVTMSNDATAVVLTPAVFASVRRAKINPLPFLFACAMVANAASFVLPISNPANLVVFREGMPPLARWMAAFLVPSILSILATFLVLRWYFRQEIRGEIALEDGQMTLSVSGRLVLIGLGLVVAVLLAASALGRNLGLPTFLAALVISAGAVLYSRLRPWKIVREISWSTLALVAALFVMVDAIQSVGMLQLAREALGYTQHLAPAAGALLTAAVVGAGNNLVNNLPLGLIAAHTLRGVHASGLLTDSILIAVDLGPNLAVSGSLATILWLVTVRREGLNVSFRDFLKVGAVAMPAALLASIAGLVGMWLIYPKL